MSEPKRPLRVEDMRQVWHLTGRSHGYQLVDGDGCFVGNNMTRADADDLARAYNREPLLERAIELLNSFEWYDWDQTHDKMRCPQCNSDKQNGHSKGCELAAIIRDTRKQLRHDR